MGSSQHKINAIGGGGECLTLAAATSLLISFNVGASAFGQAGFFEDGYYDPAAVELGEETTNEGIDGRVDVSEFLTVDIAVNNTDLAQVLQMLSMQSQKNIVMSSNVSATISADLYDVTLYEALEAILHVNGCGFIEKNGFIYVYTREELEEIDRASRVRVTDVFRLNYINAADASIFLTPMLSDDGVIALNGPVPPGFEAEVSDGGEDTWVHGNVLVVCDYPENLEEMGRVLSLLDTRPKQVLVEATVLQTTLTEENAWGIDWNIIFDANFSDLKNPLSPVDDLVTGGFQPSDNNAGSVGTNLTSFSNPSTLKIGVVSEDISVFLRVLDAVSDSNVISRPKVLALNRQRGEILIGRKIGYLSSTSTETSTTQTVQFLETGTHLKFRPFVADDDFIRMELEPSVSEGIIREVSGQNNSIFTIPDEITQELTTNVNVPNGHTIVLGGLFKEETVVSRRQVPLLGDIPLLGAAFRGQEDDIRRSEITFLITPTIMHDEVLLAEGEAAEEHLERTRIGIRRSILFWSRDRMSAQHAVRAEEYLRQGDSEMALWEIDRSLSLSPNQPLVIKMREEITGQREQVIIRSFFEDLIRERLEREGEVNLPQPAPRHVKVPVTAGPTPTLASPSIPEGPSEVATPSTPTPTPAPAVDVEEAAVSYDYPFVYGFAFDPFGAVAGSIDNALHHSAWWSSQVAPTSRPFDDDVDPAEDPFDFWRGRYTEAPTDGGLGQ